MKKRNVVAVLLGSTLAFGAAAGPAELPAGRFDGRGSWRGPQSSAGGYTVTTEIAGRTLSSTYVWAEPGKPERTETSSVTFAAPGAEPSFDVLDPAGNVVGRGYCIDAECFYRADFGGIVVEESMRWAAGALHKFGQKSGPGFQVVWTEALTER